MEKKGKVQLVWCPKSFKFVSSESLKFTEKACEQTLKDLQNLFGIKDGE